VAVHFDVSVVVATLSTSLYVLGYAFGPILWGPLSELEGRKLPIMIGMFGFSVFNIAVAVSKDLQTLMISRFFCGLFGSCPLAVVAAIYTDIFDNKQRGPAITIFAATVFMGPMLGPFIGGFIVTSYLGWRWTAYVSSIMGWLSFGLIVFFLRESYPPVVLVAKAAELRRRTKNWGIHAKQEEVEVDMRELVTKNFSRPIRLLFTEPVILLITIYMSFIYGLLYLFLTAYPLVFQGVYGMSPGVGGLPFFGMVGGLCIVAAYIILSAGGYNKKLAANSGVPVPEWRLPPVIIGGALFAAGLFWFGWTGYTGGIRWIVPTLSGLFTGFGILAIFIQLFNYIIDSYLMLYVLPSFQHRCLPFPTDPIHFQCRLSHSWQHLPALHHRRRLPSIRTPNVRRHGHPVGRHSSRCRRHTPHPDSVGVLSFWEEAEGEESI
jgi:MFS transporter, DHA1 family, multidrug resistance protein